MSTGIDILADGIYTQRQAAYLARLRPQTVTRWFEASAKGGPAVKRMMAVRSIRCDHDTSLQKIRLATSKAEEMGILFPLARDIRIYRLGETIVLRLLDGTYVEASGQYAKHYLMQPVILPYLDDVTFNAAKF